MAGNVAAPSTVPAAEPPLSSFSVQDGSQVSPLVDGIPTFRRLCELIGGAKSSVWIAVSFIDVRKWRAPNGQSFFELLTAAAKRGVDVRLLFWRLEFKNPVLAKPSSTFFGTSSDRALLAGLPAAVRWDSSGPDHRHCHHEKAWVIDGCTSEPIAVQGGIVINWAEMSSPGHPAEEVAQHHNFHDVNVEVQGRAAGDLARHFVQRWNAAHGHREPTGHWPDLARANDLPEPPAAGGQGGQRAQVLRTLRPGQLPAVPAGEASILEHYRAAIGAARHSIYLENQHIAHPELLELLYHACERGVKVVYLVPAALLQERTSWRRLAGAVEGALPWRPCFSAVSTTVDCVARALRWTSPSAPAQDLAGAELHTPSYAEAFLSWVPWLARHPNFCLAGLHVQSEGWGGSVRSIYVHSKLIIVDDAYLLVGSANLVDLSLEKDHTELAVAVWGREPACAMRDALFEEHAGSAIPAEQSTGSRPTEWLQAVARENAERLRVGEPLAGRIAQLDGNVYGCLLFLLSVAMERKAARGAKKPIMFD